ncbi:MAG: hypothetical protein JW760_04850 [Spirochaetales bacterium]|nr:hypothetical protein [Spirochaetales bacterium]
MGMIILGIVMVLYMVFVLYLAITKKPAAIWNMGKIQGFVKILGETGSRIFFIIFGLAVGGFGIYFLVR